MVYACALEDDIKNLPKGDLTLIGSNGAAISGGHRQRISIARAIYARAQLTLFDDVLSALDAKTSEQVFTQVFGEHGILRQHRVTTVLVTHAVQYLPLADQIVVLQDGKLRECGPHSQIGQSNDTLLRKIVSSYPDPLAESGSTVTSQQQAVPVIESHEYGDSEDKKLGDVQNYMHYLKAAGLGNMLFYFVCLLIAAFCSQFPSEYTQ